GNGGFEPVGLGADPVVSDLDIDEIEIPCVVGLGNTGYASLDVLQSNLGADNDGARGILDRAQDRGGLKLCKTGTSDKRDKRQTKQTFHEVCSFSMTRVIKNTTDRALGA